MEFSLPLSSILIIFATLFPLAVLFGALFLGIAVRSQSFKEAQNALTPVYMVFILPALLPLFPGIGFTTVTALLPVAGVSLLFRELMAGHADFLLGLTALLSTLIYSCMALIFAAHSFGREEVLFGGGRANGNSENGFGLQRLIGPQEVLSDFPKPGPTLRFVAVVGVLYFFGLVRLQTWFGEVGLMLSEIGLMLVPALLFLRMGGYRPTTSLSLRPAPARSFGAATLLILGGTPLVWLITWAQGFVLPMPWDFLEGMSEFLVAESPSRIAWLLILIALVPAICEEVLFRGVLLGGTHRHLRPVQAIVANGLIFGAFHVPGATVFRFLPSAFLGMLLAFVVLRTRSIWPAMLMHFINNGSIVILSASPWILERFADPNQGPPLWLMAPAVLSLGAGIALLPRGGEAEGDQGGAV